MNGKVTYHHKATLGALPGTAYTQYRYCYDESAETYHGIGEEVRHEAELYAIILDPVEQGNDGLLQEPTVQLEHEARC